MLPGKTDTREQVTGFIVAHREEVTASIIVGSLFLAIVIRLLLDRQAVGKP